MLNEQGIITKSGLTVIEEAGKYIVKGWEWMEIDKAETVRDGNRIEQKREDNRVEDWAIVL